jgi:hypothetical protein
VKLRPEQVEALGGAAPCQFTPPDKGAGTGGGADSGAKSVIVVDPDKVDGFIGIELVDTDKRPVPHAPFVVTLPDGTPVTGNLDENGKVRIEGIDPGQCTIRFPTIDRRDVV